MTHRVPFRVLALACALALTACGGQGDKSDQAGAQAPDPDNVVARVNGTPVSAVELDAQVQAMSSRGQPVQRKQALDNLINLQVLAQAAEKQDLQKQPEIAAEIRRQRDALLAQHLIRAHLSDFNVSEDDLHQAYKKRVAGMSGKEYKASHILVKKEDEAKAIIAKLDKGADFAKLAKAKSTGPSGKNGGELGWFQPDQMVKPFANAVKNLKPGHYTEKPVKTRFGWHVVLLQDVRDMKKPSYDQLKPKLRNQLISQRVQEYIQKLRDKADIEITDDSLKSKTSSSDTSTPAAADKAADDAQSSSKKSDESGDS